MKVEIDQSGKIEQLNTSTVIACANGISSAVLISPASKRKLLVHLRKSLIPRKDLIPIIFAVLLFLLIKDLSSKPTQILIDEEYTGKDDVIRETLQKLFSVTNKKYNVNIYFGRVGKSSPAHKVAWETHRKTRRKEAKIVKEGDVLAWMG